jgi:hypothetical protein
MYICEYIYLEIFLNENNPPQPFFYLKKSQIIFIGMSKALQSFGSLLEGLFFIIGKTNILTNISISMSVLVMIMHMSRFFMFF